MKKTMLAAFAALILTFGTSCGYIGQDTQATTTTTTELTIPTMPTQENSLTMPLMTSETKTTTTKSEAELKKEVMSLPPLQQSCLYPQRISLTSKTLQGMYP